MSNFWSAWIIVLTTLSLIAVTWLLFSNRKSNLKPDENNEAKTGHVYDGIEEYDNPLPAWWFNLFVLTIVFAVVYLIAYPGMGSFKGLLGWTSINQWEASVQKADEKFAHIYRAYGETPIGKLSQNTKAMKIGQRLFANNCSTCHGSDARGTIGYPNLTDKEWLYGGEPEQILASITHGRKAVMPAWAATLGGKGLEDITQYVLNMRREGGSENAAGKAIYSVMCVACHAADGTGMQSMGAPNLTDNIWLYGGSQERVLQSIASGRNGVMPAHAQLLGKEQIHILAAYVYGLSRD